LDPRFHRSADERTIFTIRRRKLAFLKNIVSVLSNGADYSHELQQLPRPHDRVTAKTIRDIDSTVEMSESWITAFSAIPHEEWDDADTSLSHFMSYFHDSFIQPIEKILNEGKHRVDKAENML